MITAGLNVIRELDVFRKNRFESFKVLILFFFFITDSIF